MSLEENKKIVRRGIEAVNEHNLALLDELMASGFVDHTLQIGGLAGAKQFYNVFFKGFPDFHMAIEDIVAVGKKNSPLCVPVDFKRTHALSPSATISSIAIWKSGKPLKNTV